MRFYSQAQKIPVGQSMFSVIEFTFSKEWRGLNKIAQFKQYSNAYNVEITDDQCYVPSELLVGKCSLRIRGYSEDQQDIIATANELILTCVQGFESGGVPPVPPTPDLYQKLIANVNADFNQNDPLAKDYIKNRTHYVESVETELISKTEFTISDENPYNLTVDDMPNSGDSCKVVFDGVSYVRQVKIVNGIIAVGNAAIALADSDDTGEPFFVTYWLDGDTMIASVGAQALGSHTIAVSLFHDVVHTLDPKYIKDMYYSKTEFSGITGYDGWAYITNQQPVTLPLVEINGKKYTDCKATDESRYIRYHIGTGSITFDRGTRTMSFSGYGDITENDILFYTTYTKVTTIPEKYIPEEIARTEQIVKPNWNTVDESAPTAILNKPVFGYNSIKGSSSNAGATLTLPTFTIPSKTLGVVLKIEQLTIQNYSESDIVYIGDEYRKIPGKLLQGNNLMIRLYKSASSNNARCISIATEYGSDYMESVLAFGMDFIGWSGTTIRIYCPGKTIKCSRYEFFSV